MLALWSLPGAVTLTALYPPAQSILVVDGPVETTERLTAVPWTFTDLGSALLVFVFVLDGVAFLLLGLFMYRTRSPYRTQVAAIVGARLFGLGTGIALYAGLFPYSDLSLVLVAYAVQSTIIAWALFRYDLLDVVPLTADTIVDQMSDAVVVLGADERLLDHNPVLSDLVEREGDLLGRHVDESLPGLRAAIEGDTATPFVPAGPASEGRHYQPQTTTRSAAGASSCPTPTTRRPSRRGSPRSCACCVTRALLREGDDGGVRRERPVRGERAAGGRRDSGLPRRRRPQNRTPL